MPEIHLRAKSKFQDCQSFRAINRLHASLPGLKGRGNLKRLKKLAASAELI